MKECEGVVKFRVEHTNAPLPSNPVLADLICLRDALHERGLVGVNIQDVGYGNVSIRHNGNRFIISGTNTGRVPQLPQNGYCLVEDCDLLVNCVRSQGPVAASSESLTHYAVYAANPKIGCVIHVHSRALFETLLHGDAPSTPVDVPYGTPAMAESVRLIAAAMPSGVIVMAGHDEGLLAFGKDCQTARAALMSHIPCGGKP